MKSFTVIFSPVAIDDLEQAVDYYEEKQAGLGVRFNQSVFHSFETLKQYPFYQVR